MKDAAIGAARQQPRPRHEDRAIAGEVAVEAGAGEGAYEPVPDAGSLAVAVETQRHAMPGDVLEGNVGEFGKEVEIELEGASHFLVAAGSLKEENIGAERGAHGGGAVDLSAKRHRRGFLGRIRTRRIPR